MQWSIVIFLGLSMVQGLAVPNLSKRIINGFLMPETLAPYVVRMVKQAGSQLYICGGSIISPNHIITAAHCVVNGENAVLPPANLTVGYGSDDINNQKFVTGASVYVHPEYIQNKVRQSRNDIAIIKIPTIQLDANTTKVPIYTGPVAPNQKLMAMGWGLTNPGATMLSMLRGVLRITGNITDCLQFNQQYTTYDGPQICSLGKLTPGESTCSGDSGSSVVINSGGTIELAGINSVAVYKSSGSCGSSDSAHFYVRPAYHMSFITNSTGLSISYLTDGKGIVDSTATNANGKAGHVATVTETVIVTPTQA
ncbi:hypothetical protein IWW36_001541 [Coemansia brasiliensis]|uniref:Peptidase S1 domain-containing protein n=1 Tax=Coemansia brasiliensis TaxID=2650707 RepID=A0A9W8IBI0_9FUNG|nr:hypothetical protein IWW36_001541 [Coemansia brasiliensis]